MQKTYKCLIADDSPIDRDVLEMYVSKIDSLQIEAVCVNGLEAAEAIKQKEIDIVFSDIDMPDLSGLELKQSLQQAPVFIFISSFAEYAVESFNLDVIDFIVKPVSLARLLKATNKAIEYIELKAKAVANIETNETAPANTPQFFFIKEDNAFTRIDNASLLYIESMGNFSKLHTLQKSHVTLISLKHLEEQLNSGEFIRIHKQFIINLQHVQSINSVDDEIILTNNQNIPIGASYKNTFMEVVGNRTLVR